MMSDPVYMNRKAMLSAFLVAAALLYLIWTFSTGVGKSGSIQMYNTWKTSKFVDIPQDVWDKEKDVKIEQRYITFSFEDQSIEIYLQEARPVEGSLKTGISVLLLHGAGDSSAVWQQRKIRTITLLASAGFQTVAVDLPGWGKSKRAAARDKPEFLRQFIKKVHLDRPVIVSPSMSGSFSIPFLMGNKDEGSCQDRARGFVPIAPVNTEAYTNAQYHRCEVPTMIVYGTKDKSLGLHSVGNLRNLLDNEIFPMEKAGHACYLDKPDEWHYLIYNFLMALHRDPEGPNLGSS